VDVQAARVTIGFALAGGRSRRMGRDKALLPWRATTLLDHALARLREACGEARILCGPETRYEDRGAAVDVDVIQDAGALGGVVTGLTRVNARDANGSGLFLAVDLPDVPTPLLRHLISLSDTFDAVVPLSPAGPEPLCAVYSARCLQPIRERVARGEYKMTCFWPDVRVRQAGPDALRAFGDPARMFRNLNSPEDWGA
jgi:molybdopterin-guanine dinucleotide biosynthesis protein A